MTEPYWSEDGLTIYCGDCREVECCAVAPTVVVTDPPWAQYEQDACGLLGEALRVIAPARAAIQLGCLTDPRMLAGVPDTLPFFRVAWLELAMPGYVGRALRTGDVAYLFGPPPKSREGQRVIPGRCLDTSSDGKQSSHEYPRKLSHVEWLVHWWSEPGELILDPFMGSGTTLLAAWRRGRPAVGIDNREECCAQAVRRLQARQAPLFVS